MSFNPLFRTDYLVFWSCVVVLFGLLLAWWGARQARRRLRIWLVSLRGLFLALVCLIALNPGRWVSPPAEGRPFAAVLLDRSASMATEDVAGQSRWDAARESLRAARERVPDPDHLRFYTFGETLREVDFAQLDELVPDAEATDIQGAGQALLNRFSSRRERLSGMLILSDGRQTTPSTRTDLAARARASDIPIAAVVLGGEVPRQDLAVRAVRRMAIAFGNQKVRLPVRLTNQGLGDRRVLLKLSDSDGTEIQRVSVDLANDSQQIVTLALSPRLPGFERFQLQVDGIDTERSLANNSDEVGVATIETPLRILMLEGTPHWDSKFLTQLVRRQEGMDITSIYRLAPERFLRIDTSVADAKQVTDEPFPASYEALAAYDLVIAGKGFEYFLTPARTALLQRYLAEAGGCVLFSRGKPYDGELADLAAIEPVTWGAALGTRIGLLPTLAGEEEGLFGAMLPAMDDPIWARLPDAACAHRVKAVHGMARVLLQSSPGENGTGQEGLPLVVSRRVGLGLSLVVNADGLWHWGFFPGDETISELYSQFWVQFFYWAATHREFLPGQEFSLRVEPHAAPPHAPVRAFIGSRHAVDGSEAMPLLQVSHEGRVVESAKPHYDGRRRWNMGLALDLPGLYTIELRDPVSGKALGPRAVVERLSPPGEKDELSADLQGLERLVTAAGGKPFGLDQMEEALAAVLPGEGEVVSSEQAHWQTTWDRQWLLIGMVLLLAAEWTLRRRSGLL
jgi:hypothetical protein